jgi:hypothetical protein
MVFSSRIASSTSVFARRRLPGRVEGAVLARVREGEGRRESTRAGERVPEVRERWMDGFGSVVTGECSGRKGRVGVAIVPIVVPDSLLSWVVVLFWLCTLLRLELPTMGLR